MARRRGTHENSIISTLLTSFVLIVDCMHSAACGEAWGDPALAVGFRLLRQGMTLLRQLDWLRRPQRRPQRAASCLACAGQKRVGFEAIAANTFANLARLTSTSTDSLPRTGHELRRGAR